MLVSEDIIADAEKDSWSELLTSLFTCPLTCLWGVQKRVHRIPQWKLKFWSIVSNPAQHRRPWAVIVELRKVQNEKRPRMAEFVIVHVSHP